MSHSTLIVFVKNKIYGKVKTRLARSIGHEEALHVYQLLLDYTRKQVAGLSANTEVWYSDKEEADDGWEELSVVKKVQAGDDLGERMSYAFAEAFQNGAGKVIIIGSDCAEIDTEIINSAFQLLSENEVVIGPAEDGGYYLIGMHKFIPCLFKQIEWSTSEVFDKTVKKLVTSGNSYSLLPTLHDVDTIDDWLAVKSRFESGL
ncbi:MAG TPA: glycosyltransferase [Balneolaceae bacterium]|nr:glycosyltransferase [Balneolaceae bacterium]